MLGDKGWTSENFALYFSDAFEVFPPQLSLLTPTREYRSHQKWMLWVPCHHTSRRPRICTNSLLFPSVTIDKGSLLLGEATRFPWAMDFLLAYPLKDLLHEYSPFSPTSPASPSAGSFCSASRFTIISPMPTNQASPIPSKVRTYEIGLKKKKQLYAIHRRQTLSSKIKTDWRWKKEWKRTANANNRERARGAILLSDITDCETETVTRNKENFS